jgi:hypothetical protein
VNNFVLVIALIAYSAGESGLEPKSAYPFLLFLLVILLFPLSSDPLREVPPSRRALWPITPGEQFLLRLASLTLNPVLWLVVLLAIFHRVRPSISIAFLSAAIVVSAIATVGRVAIRWTIGVDPTRTLLKFVPPFPGSLGLLVTSNLRQMVMSLDVYLAFLLSFLTGIYRWFSTRTDPYAFPILSILIALILSSYAQCLFGRDLASTAVERYRLFPVTAVWVLAAKGAAFLLINLILVAPAHVISGMTFGFTALAFGHHASVIHAAPLRAWRFSGSRVYIGAIQGVAAIILAFGAVHDSRYFLLSIALYAVSLAIYAPLWNRRVKRNGI